MSSEVVVTEFFDFVISNIEVVSEKTGGAFVAFVNCAKRVIFLTSRTSSFSPFKFSENVSMSSFSGSRKPFRP